MIIQPRVRGFICTTAHPDGCRANVLDAKSYASSHPISNGPKTALVVGCSAGYGLASRAIAGFSCGASTIGVSLDRPPSDRGPGTAGWYNNAAFDEVAKASGIHSHTFNGDAFSNEVKNDVVQHLRENSLKIDLVVYSLASPVRTDPVDGTRYRSAIKPIGEALQSQTLVPDITTGGGILKDVDLEPASDEEISATIKVMGGEDWQLWVQSLADAGVLAENAQTVAFTYLGNDLTERIYRQGTLGKAKEDLDRACIAINDDFVSINVQASVAVLKAVVTQASTAIPVVPLYFSILFDVMKEAGTHEDCVEHIHRMYAEQLYTTGQQRRDTDGRLRLDNLELDDQIQAEVRRRWGSINEENLSELADVQGFCDDFLNLFGFGRSDVDYEADVDQMYGV